MDQHLHHVEEHFSGSDFIRDVVIGMSDGLTVPFALSADLSDAVDTTTLILKAGAAEMQQGQLQWDTADTWQVYQFVNFY